MRDGIGRIRDPFIAGEQAFGVHRTSASARIAFNCSRKAAVSDLGGGQLLQELLRVPIVVVLAYADS